MENSILTGWPGTSSVSLFLPEVEQTLAGFFHQLPARAEKPWLLHTDRWEILVAAMGACAQKGMVPWICPGTLAPAVLGEIEGVVTNTHVDFGSLPVIRPLHKASAFAPKEITPAQTALVVVREKDGVLEKKPLSFGQINRAVNLLESGWGTAVAGKIHHITAPTPKDWVAWTVQCFWPLVRGNMPGNTLQGWEALPAGAAVLTLSAKEALTWLDQPDTAKKLGDKQLFILGDMPQDQAWALGKHCARPPVSLSATEVGELDIRPYPGFRRSPLLLDNSQENDIRVLRYKVPDNLVYLEGHFPQAAVVPGVCQIKWVVDAIKEITGQQPITERMEAVKFHRLLFPGQEFEMFLRFDGAKHKWHYHMTCEDQKVASGRLIVKEGPTT